MFLCLLDPWLSKLSLIDFVFFFHSRQWKKLTDFVIFSVAPVGKIIVSTSDDVKMANNMEPIDSNRIQYFMDGKDESEIDRCLTVAERNGTSYASRDLRLDFTSEHIVGFVHVLTPHDSSGTKFNCRATFSFGN